MANISRALMALAAGLSEGIREEKRYRAELALAQARQRVAERQAQVGERQATVAEREVGLSERRWTEAERGREEAVTGQIRATTGLTTAQEQETRQRMEYYVQDLQRNWAHDDAQALMAARRVDLEAQRNRIDADSAYLAYLASHEATTERGVAAWRDFLATLRGQDTQGKIGLLNAYVEFVGQEAANDIAAQRLPLEWATAVTNVYQTLGLLAARQREQDWTEEDGRAMNGLYYSQLRPLLHTARMPAEQLKRYDEYFGTLGQRASAGPDPYLEGLRQVLRGLLEMRPEGQNAVAKTLAGVAARPGLGPLVAGSIEAAGGVETLPALASFGYSPSRVTFGDMVRFSEAQMGALGAYAGLERPLAVGRPTGQPTQLGQVPGYRHEPRWQVPSVQLPMFARFGPSVRPAGGAAIGVAPAGFGAALPPGSPTAAVPRSVIPLGTETEEAVRQALRARYFPFAGVRRG